MPHNIRNKNVAAWRVQEWEEAKGKCWQSPSKEKSSYMYVHDASMPLNKMKPTPLCAKGVI